MRRPGSVRAAFHVKKPRRLGRLIRCPGCGRDVDIIEVGVIRSMRPDLCGDCQPLARELEPVVDTGGGRHHANPQPTELAAARAVRAGSQRALVLDYLRAAGDRGATDFEMNTELAPGRSVSAGTRRAELITAGYPIVDSGERRPTDTGTPAIVWRLEQ